MNETDKLRHLDVVARRSVAELDAALGTVTPPAPPSRTPPSRSRWAPLLIAAALLAVALVSAATLVPSDEEGTVASEADIPVEADANGTTRIILADPEAHGFTIRAAGRGNRYDDDFDDLTIHEPIEGSTPAVAASTGEYHEHGLSGVVVEIGGPPAVLRPWDTDGVMWRDGDRLHRIAASQLDPEALVDLAATAVAAGWNGDGPLPGHRIALRGTSADTMPLFELGMLPPRSAVISYDHDGPLNFAISTHPGSETHWRAGFIHARNPRTVDVGGRDVVVADYFGTRTLQVASWLETDDTIVRVGTYGDIAELLDLIGDDLVAVDMKEFDAVAAAHPPQSGAGMFPFFESFAHTDVLESLEGPVSPPPGGRVLADATFRPDDAAFRATLLEDDTGTLSLISMHSSRGSGGAGGFPLLSFDEPVATATPTSQTSATAFTSTRMVAAVLPAGWSVTEVRHRDTKRPFTVTDSHTDPVQGADANLIATLIQTDDFEEPPLEVVLNSGTHEHLYWP